MPSLTLKNVPGELYLRLKRSAAQHRRSMNSEAIVCLERALASRSFDTEAFLERLRTIHRSQRGIYLTDETIDRAKREGRP